MSTRSFVRVAAVGVLIGLVTTTARGEKLYWREWQNPTTYIKRPNLDGTNTEALVTISNIVSNSHGLALDPAGGKMYWAERENNKIRRANLDGSDAEDVVTAVNLPLNIALDIPGDRVYWTQDDPYEVLSPFDSRLPSLPESGLGHGPCPPSPQRPALP